MNVHQLSKIHDAINGAISELTPGLGGLLCEIEAFALGPRERFTPTDFRDLSDASLQLATALHSLKKCRDKLDAFR